MGVTVSRLKLNLESLIQERQITIINHALSKLKLSADIVTPVKTGNLKSNWETQEASLFANEIEGKLINTTPYAKYVEKKRELLKNIKQKAEI